MRYNAYTGTDQKKTLHACEQKEAERAAWQEKAQTLDASKLVFLDECGSNIALTRFYTRAPKGKRACGAVPRNRRANITLLASLSLQGMGEALILEGSADSTAFEIYVERILVPSLQAGQIVIMDNLSTLTGSKVRQAIEARRANFCFSHPTPPIFHRLKRHSDTAESLFTPCGSTHSRGLTRGDWASTPHDHTTRCPRMVYALWVRSS